MERIGSLDLETALERTAPTRTQWDARTRREPSLAGLDVRRPAPCAAHGLPGPQGRAPRRARPRHPCRPGRVRCRGRLPAARSAAPRRPLRARRSIAKRRSLSWWMRSTRPSPATTRPSVRGSSPAGCWHCPPADSAAPPPTSGRGASTSATTPIRLPHAAAVELSAAAMLASAVDAGVVTGQDAQLILDTRIAGRSLREAAQRLGLRYETAKKRRQRAEARLATWWTSRAAPAPLRRSADRPRCEEVA